VLKDCKAKKHSPLFCQTNDLNSCQKNTISVQVPASCLRKYSNKQSKAVLDFNGLSILEVSHRSQDFIDVMEEARENIKKALNVPAGYTVFIYKVEQVLVS
jgi:hypothetical protein